MSRSRNHACGCYLCSHIPARNLRDAELIRTDAVQVPAELEAMDEDRYGYDCCWDPACYVCGDPELAPPEEVQVPLAVPLRELIERKVMR